MIKGRGNQIESTLSVFIREKESLCYFIQKRKMLVASQQHMNVCKVPGVGSYDLVEIQTYESSGLTSTKFRSLILLATIMFTRIMHQHCILILETQDKVVHG